MYILINADHTFEKKVNVYYSKDGVDNYTTSKNQAKQFTLKEILAIKKAFPDKNFIIAPVDTSINCVLTLVEAAELWNKEPSSLRRVIQHNKFVEGVDYRKSSKTWLITYKSMERVYGNPFNS